MVKLKELLKKGVRREIKARRIFQSMGIYEHQLRPVPIRRKSLIGGVVSFMDAEAARRGYKRRF